MKVKGTAVKTILEYVKDKYSDYYDKWFYDLGNESKEIFINPILATSWYDLETSIIQPMKILATIVKIEEKDIFWDMGVYSSVSALNGIYKVFIRISSTSFIISRASNIIQTYYKDTEVNILDKTDNKVTLELLKFSKDVNLIMYRIGGWVENTFKAVGCKNVNVELKHVEDSYETKTILIITWD